MFRIYARGRMQKFSATAHTHANVATTKRRKKDRFQAIQGIYAATPTNFSLFACRRKRSKRLRKTRFRLIRRLTKRISNFKRVKHKKRLGDL